MNRPYVWILEAVILFAGMVVLMETGRHFGARDRQRDPEARARLGSVEGALFGLFGLLIAFTFSGALSRFDERRQLVVEEANCIGTAWLRLDLLRPEAQPSVRDRFRRYVDLRLEVYRYLPDVEKAKAAWQRADVLQSEIWKEAVAACNAEADYRAAVVLLPALNQMFDIATTRTMAFLHHPPNIVYDLLFAMALGCSMLAGYGMAGGKTRSITHIIAFAVMTGITVYVILDLEHPRAGFFRVDSVDRVLIHVRDSMK